MMLEPPFNLPFAAADRKPDDPPRWRHMKNACGENIRRVYKQTRMDLAVRSRSVVRDAASPDHGMPSFVVEFPIRLRRGTVGQASAGRLLREGVCRGDGRQVAIRVVS